MSITEPKRIDLNNGDKVWIGETEFRFTSTEDITGKPGGFLSGWTGYEFAYDDGVRQYSVDEYGRVGVCGAIIGEIHNGEYEAYAEPLI